MDLLLTMLVVTLGVVFVRLASQRDRVMAYHRIETPPVHAATHGGNGGC